MSRYVPTNCCQQYQYMLLLLLSEKILDPQQAGIMFFCIQHSHSLRTASQVSYEAEAEDREDSGLSSLPKHHKEKARLHLRGPICTGSNKSRFKLWWKRTDGDLTGWSSVHLHKHKFAPHSSISAYKCHTLLDIFATFWLPGSHHRLCGTASGCLRHFSRQKILTTKLSMTWNLIFFSSGWSFLKLGS